MDVGVWRLCIGTFPYNLEPMVYVAGVQSELNLLMLIFHVLKF